MPLLVKAAGLRRKPPPRLLSARVTGEMGPVCPACGRQSSQPAAEQPLDGVAGHPAIQRQHLGATSGSASRACRRYLRPGIWLNQQGMELGEPAGAAGGVAMTSRSTASSAPGSATIPLPAGCGGVKSPDRHLWRQGLQMPADSGLHHRPQTNESNLHGNFILTHPRWVKTGGQAAPGGAVWGRRGQRRPFHSIKKRLAPNGGADPALPMRQRSTAR